MLTLWGCTTTDKWLSFGGLGLEFRNEYQATKVASMLHTGQIEGVVFIKNNYDGSYYDPRNTEIE